MIGLIRDEKHRKLALLQEESPDFAHDRWNSGYEPLFNDLCLSVIVSIRHQLERELIYLGARVTDGGSGVDEDQYRRNVQDERDRLKKQGGWRQLAGKLSLFSFPEWNSSMETLHLLVNLYKHSPTQQPDEELLKHLGLDLNENYATLSESDLFLEGLAKHMALPKGADYCDVAERFLDLTKGFLRRVENQAMIGRVERPWFTRGFGRIPR